MTDNPLISIIIPVYNVEQYLTRCLDSVINQTYSNLEIIIVDDGSTDNSGSICDEYSKADSRIMVIHQANGGLSAARNTGINNASGDMIGFLDSDDYVDANAYNMMLNRMLLESSDMVVCSYDYVDENGKSLARKSPINTDLIVDTYDYFKLLTEENGGYYITAWNKLYRRSLFEDIRFPVGKVHEDNFIVHLIVSKCKKISIITNSLFYYTQRSNNISSGSKVVKRFDNIEALINRADYYGKNGYDALLPELMQQICSRYIEIQRKYLFHSSKKYSDKQRAHCIRKIIKDCCLKNEKHVTNNIKNRLLFPDLFIILDVLSERLKIG